MMKYIGKNSIFDIIVYNSTEKHKMQKMVHFEINFYIMKLNLYFNESNAVITL